MSRNLFKPDFDTARANRSLDFIAQVIRREFSNLIKLNLLVLVTGLLIVTIPAALTATARIIILLASDEKVDLAKEFFCCFRKEFIASTVGGFQFIGLLLACAFAETFYIIYFSDSWIGIFLVLVGCFLLVIIVMATYHYFVLQAIADAKLKTNIRNAWLLALVRLPSNFLYLIIVSLIISTHIALWPYSALFIVFVSLSFVLLILTVNAYENFEALVFTTQEDDNGKN